MVNIIPFSFSFLFLVTNSKFTLEVSVPFDFQDIDYNGVFESLAAGPYSITVRAENNVGLGPMSDPVLVSVPSIGKTMEPNNNTLYLIQTL